MSEAEWEEEAGGGTLDGGSCPEEEGAAAEECPRGRAADPPVNGWEGKSRQKPEGPTGLGRLPGSLLRKFQR